MRFPLPGSVAGVHLFSVALKNCEVKHPIDVALKCGAERRAGRGGAWQPNYFFNLGAGTGPSTHESCDPAGGAKKIGPDVEPPPPPAVYLQMQ